MQNNTFISIAICMLLVTVCVFQFAPLVHAQIGQGQSGGTGIKNPLEGSSTITDVLKRVINWMLGLVGIIALVALISAGARMIFGFVDEDQVKKAKTTILWAVIGLAVVILSYAIINIVTKDILGAGSGSSGNQYENNPGQGPDQLQPR